MEDSMSDTPNEVNTVDASTPPTPPKRRKGIRSAEELTATATPKLRKHLLTTAYKQDVAAKLDKLHAAGHTILSVTSSSDVRGFEIVSYTEE
jgi:hypothetical protein